MLGGASSGGKFHTHVFCTDRELYAAAFGVESGQSTGHCGSKGNHCGRRTEEVLDALFSHQDAD